MIKMVRADDAAAKAEKCGIMFCGQNPKTEEKTDPEELT
jgi:hypothetical protein